MAKIMRLIFMAEVAPEDKINRGLQLYSNGNAMRVSCAE
uniref:Uncharacterized protein n=1 Tax=Escherichia coli TaxID=562 RepID=A0A075MEH6_ECOLX|nr:hypothetical protein [Escherichia coli]